MVKAVMVMKGISKSGLSSKEDVYNILPQY